ncbi:MAG: ABC transporter ATP-binding protein [Chloroflexi bacterium]|nr:ABC transporter ATP-binding protein [Chloroflexota bacterium]
MNNSKILMEVRGLKKHFPITAGLFSRQVGLVKAVDDVSFSIHAGETFALVGESGSGKTTVGRTVIRILPPTAGDIIFEGTNIAQLSEETLKPWRRQMQMVFQDPAAALNPRRRVADSIAAPLEIHNVGTTRERLQRVRELLDLVEIPTQYMYRYPHALSGGQKQRVCIARALALSPKLVVQDEPTSALDVSVQAKILALLIELQKRLGLTYLLISHDLSVVKTVANHVAVMYLGKIVEMAPTDQLFARTFHPYTRALLSAVPVIMPEEQAMIPEEIILEGEIPSPSRVPPGCVFQTRCYMKVARCAQEEPPLREVSPGDWVRCFLV